MSFINNYPIPKTNFDKTFKKEKGHPFGMTFQIYDIFTKKVTYAKYA